jgi:hypothetical protein
MHEQGVVFVKTNWSYFIQEHDEVCFIIYYTQPLDIIIYQYYFQLILWNE